MIVTTHQAHTTLMPVLLDAASLAKSRGSASEVVESAGIVALACSDLQGIVLRWSRIGSVPCPLRGGVGTCRARRPFHAENL